MRTSLTFLFLFYFSQILWAQEDVIRKGKALAQAYCASCHAFPEPSQLNKEIWQTKVLPQMAAYIGFQEAQESQRIWEGKSTEEIAILKKLNVYPATSLLEKKDFQAIEAYYKAESPKELVPQVTKLVPLPLVNFEPQTLFIEGIQSPKTSMVAINEERGELLIADAGTNHLYAKDRQDELFTLPEISSPVVQFFPKAPQVYNFLSIGSISPSDLSQGGLYEMDLNKGTWEMPLSGLSRPVFAQWADLIQDGKPDLLLCNYGHHGGNISVYPNGELTSDPLILGGTGARKLEVLDLNKDGNMDIVALFCQGNERISVFYGKGNGSFDSEKILLRFSPLMGSSYFEMKDLTGDGLPDILFSNGDNWDYSAIPKPYHGFRIYENKGAGQFEEKWFYPQYGAAKAMAWDYDQDGDLDLATIAFYDDLENPAQQFLLFENQENFNFQPYFIQDAALGKWMTMDMGDLDADGDQDLVLGAYLHNTLEYTKLVMLGIREIPSALILENKGIRN